MSIKNQLYCKANETRITLLLFIDKEIRNKKNLSKNFENIFICKKEVKEEPTIYIKFEETFSNENSSKNKRKFFKEKSIPKSFIPSTKTENFTYNNNNNFNESTEESSNSPKITISKNKINSVACENKFDIELRSKNYTVRHFCKRDSTICFEHKNCNKFKKLNYEKYLLNLANNLKIKKKQKHAKKSCNNINRRKK